MYMYQPRTQKGVEMYSAKKRKEREWILSSEPKNIHYHKLRIPAQYEFTIKGINKMKFSL